MRRANAGGPAIYVLSRLMCLVRRRSTRHVTGCMDELSGGGEFAQTASRL